MSEQALRYEANKKSTLLTYFLWFFVGWFGGHRFFMGKTKSAIGMLVLCFLSIFTAFVFIESPLIMVLLIWQIVDAFLIPGWVRKYNNVLIDELEKQYPAKNLAAPVNQQQSAPQVQDTTEPLVDSQTEQEPVVQAELVSKPKS